MPTTTRWYRSQSDAEDEFARAVVELARGALRHRGSRSCSEWKRRAVVEELFVVGAS